MYITRRFVYCVVAVALTLALGHLWSALFRVGMAGAALFALGCIVNLLLLYAGKPQFDAIRINPERLSLGDDNPISLHLHNHYGQKVKVEVMDEPPFTLQMRDLKLEAELEAGGEADLSYTVRPTRRGAYVFHNMKCYVSTWPHLLQRKFKTDQSFRTKVYPSFLFLRSAQLLSEANRNNQWGTRNVRRIGQSREFEKIREYVVGDDYRNINWKASARRHQFMVNEYQDEQAQNIYAVIDKGRGMQHTFNGLSLFDHSLNSALRLAYLSIRHADNAGLLTFEKEVETFIPAARGSNQLHKMVDGLFAEVSEFRQSDYFNLYQFCKQKLQKRSLLIVYTTFDSLTSLRRQLPYLKKLSAMHVVLVTFFVDKDVETLAQTPASEPIDYVTQMVAHKFSFEQKMVVNELRRHGIYSLLTAPEQLNTNVLNHYLELKSRRII